MSPGAQEAAQNGHVFVSYARDGGVGASWAGRIRERLEAAGIAVWQDESDLAPGSRLSASIARGIDGARAVVCVLSPGAGNREWVEREIAYALRQGHASPAAEVPVIPVVVADGVDLPFLLGTRAAMNFRGREDDPWPRLLDALGALASPDEPREAEVAYLQDLLQRHRLELAETLYVPLAGERRTVEQPAPARAFDCFMPQSFELLDARFESRSAARPPGEASEFHDVLEVLAASKRLVLLGEPGAGKTFSLRRAMAHFAREALADPSAPIPIFVPLAAWLEEDEPLDGFVTRACTGGSLDWRAVVDAGRACLLLDGLNEMPTAQREVKATAIRELAHDARLPVVVASCRQNDFQGPIALDLNQARIRALEPMQVRDFLHAYLDGEDGEDAERLFWHLAGGAAVLDVWRTWEAAGASFEQFWSVEDLEKEVPEVYGRTSYEQDRTWRQMRSDERSLLTLVESPFFLTAVVHVFARGGLDAVGGNEARLLGALVDVRIADECGRHREREGCEHPGAAGLQDGLGALAWGMQEQAGGPQNVQLAIAEAEAVGRLTSGGLGLARDAGLLTRDDPVRFAHQLFQEYFVALRLRALVEARAVDAAALWPRPNWWERRGWEVVARLAAGLAPHEPGPMVEWLRDAQPAVLADCLSRAGVDRPEAGVMRELQRSWFERLDSANEPALEGRHHVALALGGLGLDDRPGVGLDADGLPDIEWVEVEGGAFVWQEGERREVEGFWLARHPVTNAQYQAFIDDGGYADEQWWSGLAGRIESPERPGWNESNRPRETVSWYEAVAFSRWFGARAGYEVRLPTEVEWERAARGRQGRVYPWGEEYVSGYANVNETGDKTGPHYLSETSAVGIYPQGATPEGLMDLSGNVREWCLNPRDVPESVSSEGDSVRGLRGGSWDGNVAGCARVIASRSTPASATSTGVFGCVVRPPWFLPGADLLIR